MGNAKRRCNSPCLSQTNWSQRRPVPVPGQAQGSPAHTGQGQKDKVAGQGDCGQGWGSGGVKTKEALLVKALELAEKQLAISFYGRGDVVTMSRQEAQFVCGQVRKALQDTRQADDQVLGALEALLECVVPTGQDTRTDRAMDKAKAALSKAGKARGE